MDVKSSPRRRPVLPSARLLLVLLLVASLQWSSPTAAAIPSTRLAGATRYDTAAAIARAGFASAEIAVVVRGDDFPDALAAGGVAGALQAPILLTLPDRLPDATVAVLRDLGVGTVVVLGGPSAVSPDVEAAIEAMDIAVERYGGTDRYDSAARANTAVFDASIRPGRLDGSTTAVVASGEAFADAIAVGTLAYELRLPILLTRRSVLPDATADFLSSPANGIEQVLVVGGIAAVSSEVLATIEALGPTVRRVAGASRHETATQVADLFPEPSGVVIARGDIFPDALAAASLGEPILLTVDDRELGDVTAGWLDGHEIPRTVLGGAPTSWWRPQLGETWHLQLNGELVTDIDVDVFDVDLFDTPAEAIDALHEDGRRVVCYVSAGSWEEWRPDADTWSESVLGEPLDGWEGERWVDVRAIDVIGPILEARFDLAVARGCDGVDPDNVDGFLHDTGFALTTGDSLAFNRFLIEAAHTRGLAVGLKNALDLVEDLADEVDFAVNEECVAFDECDRLEPYDDAGRPVFGVEYEGSLAHICDSVAAVGAWLLADLELDGRAQACRTG